MDGGWRGRGQNVEEMYKETTVVVRVEEETSEQFGVGVGLRQGSALGPLLFIMVMNMISGKVHEQVELIKDIIL